METQAKASAKDFFINLGAIVALYTLVISLLNLLFRVINNAYPQITSEYSYFGNSSSISWPVSVLIIFFPVFILLMWLLEKGYVIAPEKRYITVKRWLTYITLFVAGIVLAIDLVTVLYYFIDGRELTAGFVMKILSVFVVTLMVFLYYISELREKLNSQKRKIWLVVAFVVILGSVLWGFSVLGSPRTQQLLKYDQQKINDLQNLSAGAEDYYRAKGVLPNTIADIGGLSYNFKISDQQTGEPYEYQKTDNVTYKVCAKFNKESPENNTGNNFGRPYSLKGTNWTHPAGRYCFPQTIDSSLYPVYTSPQINYQQPMEKPTEAQLITN